MKKLLFSVCILFSVFTAGQTQNEPATLFGNIKQVNIRGFGGPMVALTTLDGAATLSIGGGGAVLINNFFIGGYGLSTVSSNVQRRVSGEDLYLKTSQGGFWLGYDFTPSSLIHFTTSTRLGWGRLRLYREINSLTFPNDNEDRSVFTEGFGVITPELGIEVNLTRFMKVAFTGGYQIAFSNNFKTDAVSAIDLNGALGAITFKFGWFGR
ncbi:hypothetical protein BKI52_09235 [marine bacterium AO1-C]|nr:hypothetical protein BKI52_09235 [marine bacterium AO1-C]